MVDKLLIFGFKTCIFLLFGWIFYKHLAVKFDSWSLRMAQNRRWFSKYSVSQLEGLVNILVAGVFQLIIAAILLLIFPVPIKGLLFENFAYIHILLGFLLGIAHLVGANLIGSVIIFMIKNLGGTSIRSQFNNQPTKATSGWINSFLNSSKLQNLPLFLVVVFFYIMVEEIIFRGIILSSYLQIVGLPIEIAVLAGLTLFVIAQSAGMPSFASAIYPMSSAVAMGITHCLLILFVPSLIPLIIAHFTFFYLSLVSNGGQINCTDDQEKISLGL